MTDNWMFNGKIVTQADIPEWAVSFIYIIRHTTAPRGQIIDYVGKKQLLSNRRKKIGVREKITTKTRKRYKTVTTNSDWQKYWGSSKSLKAAKETGIGTWTRTILHWCHSKKHASYLETKTQFEFDVLGRETYNDHIQNWYRWEINKDLYDKHIKERKENTKK